MKMKATAEAPANLAFVKYWGKKDAGLRLPTNNSISVNLSGAKTITTVEFDEFLNQDILQLEGKPVSPRDNFLLRVSSHLDLIRSMAGTSIRAAVQTQNNFPIGVGIASSASGFAALTLAACSALDLNLTEKGLSILARQGSGSACRSIPDGFCEWNAGESNENSFAFQIAPPDHWDICIQSVIVSKRKKSFSSTSGHELAVASPFFSARLAELPNRLNLVRSAIIAKDFTTFGQQTEMEAISFHTIAMTSPIKESQRWFSGAYYWLPDSLEIMLAVQGWRKDGLEVYFTLDAGPTVHLLCLKDQQEQVMALINDLETAQLNRHWEVLVNYPSIGARLLK